MQTRRKNSTQKILRKIYLDPAHQASFSSAHRLYTAAKKLLPKLTLKQVKEWLPTQDVYTLHKRVRVRFPRRKTLVPSASYQYQADLVDMSKLKKENRQFTFLLNVVDCFSRKLFSEPIKTKSNANVVKGFKKIFKRMKKLQNSCRVTWEKSSWGLGLNVSLNQKGYHILLLEIVQRKVV